MSGFLLIKNPQASNTPRDECAYVGPGPLRLTAACAVPPCFFTCVKPLIVIQLRSAVHLLRIADLAPSIGSPLPWRGNLLHHRCGVVLRFYLTLVIRIWP